MYKSRMTTMKILMVLVALFLASCSALGPPSSKRSMTKSDQALPVPTSDTAVIVFVLQYEDKDTAGRFLLGGFQPQHGLIWDVTSGSPKLVEAIKTNQKFKYEVPAGEHVFVIGASFLIANVDAGKTYYVYVDEGAMVRTHKIYPVRNGSPGRYQYSSTEFQDALAKTKLSETTPEGREYYERDMWTKGVENVMKKEWTKFKNQPESYRKEFTLNPEDGI